MEQVRKGARSELKLKMVAKGNTRKPKVGVVGNNLRILKRICIWVNFGQKSVKFMTISIKNKINALKAFFFDLWPRCATLKFRTQN